jgi:hypothetical protein
MIWGSMILWEVSLYAHFNEQAYINNKKIYGLSPYKVHWVSGVVKKAMKSTSSPEWLEAR